jgi:hypothetical protein
MQLNYYPRYYSSRVIFCLLLVIFVVVLSACGSSDGAPAQSMAIAEDSYYVEETEMIEPGEPARGGDYADGTSVAIETYLASAVQAQETRVIIYTGNIALVVRDTETAVQGITQLVNEQGGYVSGSNIYQAGESLRGSVTVRIPAERYQATVDQLRGLALRVERESSSTEDVTEEFTDLQARKANLEVTEGALQQLLVERQQVGSTSDILEVHRELTNIRGQIEQIEGRLRYLANQAALSTITIELTPDALYQPISVGGWEPRGVAKDALQALIEALQGLTNIVIWLVIFMLPLFVIFLIPLAILIVVIRWWWQRRQQRRKSQAPPSETETKSETNG